MRINFYAEMKSLIVDIGLKMGVCEFLACFDCGRLLAQIICKYLWCKGLWFSDKTFWVKKVLKLLRKIKKSL